MFQEQTKKYKVLISPNSMKGSLDAYTFAEIISSAFHSVSDLFETEMLPVGDGGDGTGEILRRTLGYKKVEIFVHDPLKRKIKVSYGIKGDKAIIEMADASGIKLLSSEERNPLKTSSIGTGELIMDAIDRGVKDITIGIGGSVTVDGGMGLLEGLGVIFYDDRGKQLSSSGLNVGKIDSWDDCSLKKLRGINIRVLCDVDNVLSGREGAVYFFAGQKGAAADDFAVLEKNLLHFSEKIKEKKGYDLSGKKSMGAAGGINLALVGFLNSVMVPGADTVLECIGFKEHLKDVSLVITGEGKIDSQTNKGKAPYAVCCKAHKYGILVYAIGGQVMQDGKKMFDRTYSLVNENITAMDAIDNVKSLVFDRAVQAAKDFLYQ